MSVSCKNISQTPSLTQLTWFTCGTAWVIIVYWLLSYLELFLSLILVIFIVVFPFLFNTMRSSAKCDEISFSEFTDNFNLTPDEIEARVADALSGIDLSEVDCVKQLDLPRIGYLAWLIDVANAYKNLIVLPSHRKKNIIAVFNPEEGKYIS